MITTDTHSAAGTRWRLDPEASRAEFHVPTFWGLTTVHGRFRRLDGRVDADGRMELVIEAASLDTGNRRRDRHLRSPDFFDCEHHPEVRFRCADVRSLDADRIHIAGELQAAGRRVRLELEPTVRRTGERLEIDAETTIDQRALGMTVRRFGIRTPAAIAVRARLHAEA